jgi:hypothetical protein
MLQVNLEDGFSTRLLAEAYMDKAKQYRNLEYKIFNVQSDLVKVVV